MGAYVLISIYTLLFRDFYVNKVNNYKINLLHTFGNLSCVLEQINTFNSSGDINLQKFSYQGVRKQFKSSEIIFDNVFLRSLAVGYEDCIKIADQWPQTQIDRWLANGFIYLLLGRILNSFQIVIYIIYNCNANLFMNHVRLSVCL